MLPSKDALQLKFPETPTVAAITSATTAWTAALAPQAYISMIFYSIPVPLAGSFQFAAVAQGSSLSSLLFLTYSPASTTSSPARNGYVSCLKSFANVCQERTGQVRVFEGSVGDSVWMGVGIWKMKHQKTKKGSPIPFKKSSFPRLFPDFNPIPLSHPLTLQKPLLAPSFPCLVTAIPFHP